jgi:GST-like protein
LVLVAARGAAAVIYRSLRDAHRAASQILATVPPVIVRSQPGEIEMAGSYVVYGRSGTGSVPVEATLLLLGAPYEVKEAGRDVTAADIARVNPMEQLPAVILPNGEVMTESAAILIHLADSHPAARLSPPIGDPRRPAFLRWMTFVSAQIYGLVWVRDDPRRLAVDAAHEAVIVERTAERRAYCWRMMDAQVNPGRYARR